MIKYDREKDQNGMFFSYHEMLIQIRNKSLILQKMVRIKLPSFHATVEIRILREN